MLRVDGLTYEDLLEYDFGSVLKEHKILGFKSVYLTPEQQFFVSKKLYEHGCCISLHSSNPVCVFTGVGGSYVMPRYLAPENTDPDFTINGNWHVDEVSSYVLLSMTHFEEMDDSWGNTVFIDLEDLYEKCPYKEQLETAYVQNFPSGIVSSALRTHPVTGKTTLLYSDLRQLLVGKEHFWELTYSEDGGYKQREPIDHPQEDWFNDYKEWVMEEMGKETNQLKWVYDEGDFVIFDNRCLAHSFSVFEQGKRFFNRALAGAEMIWYGDKPEYIQEVENEIPIIEESEPHHYIHEVESHLAVGGKRNASVNEALEMLNVPNPSGDR